MTDRAGTETPANGRPPAAPRRLKVRSVIEIRPGRAGTSELRLECGHVLRRRLALCPPTRVICPEC
jgi:hypothetical protein